MSGLRFAVPQPAVTLGVAVLLTYLLVAKGIGDLYPFSTFSMYSGHPTESGSKILGRAADGRLREISSYDHWACPSTEALLREDTCGAAYRIDYIDREAREYLSGHASEREAPGSQPVEVVRRVWRFGSGAPVIQDCPLIQCRAVPR